MLILSPMEPWPGELALEAAERHGVDVIARVVDYGGLFWDDVLPGHDFAERDHRLFRPQGWIEAGREKLERMRPVAERHGLTPLQLSCAWDLAHGAGRRPSCRRSSRSPAAAPVEAKRDELAATPRPSPLSAEEVAELRDIGDNRGSMLLKGATPDHDGPRADRPLERRRAARRARRPLADRPGT